MSPLFLFPSLNGYSNMNLGEGNSPNYCRSLLATLHEKTESQLQALSVWVIDVLMDSQIHIFILPGERKKKKKKTCVEKPTVLHA